ncbi:MULTISPECIES: hypothetical protein [Bradyrhizobium]|uniref:Blr7653 protein n=2 Tax=Bradyrhizobium diazoefficiens TaxID=1355477 RepID=Q89CZ2_BRADU|nr:MULTISPECIES: hypothetical protein [Bradyrhizobium]MBP1061942.1 hypothetical protein [Bradyrhizobium japonicum]AND92581.1 hypothetical protein AAV28_35975 [Bradyrhizobium diazoefficiens USDA 110]APO52145.1 hypothetical protein BD122_17745 [Bradyrhizobium diazoefficiens]AWO94454.1 hypothetical protein DI395_42165 [Bradyrhizobium diazoefficiens]KGJ71293.1 hypothetical protein BJA5080_07818 [Bradyrhizobium diazoefficiens SEMIA 5080]
MLRKVIEREDGSRSRLFLGAFVLLTALIYGVLSYHYPNRALDRVAEKVTRERYRRNETWRDAIGTSILARTRSKSAALYRIVVEAYRLFSKISGRAIGQPATSRWTAQPKFHVQGDLIVKHPSSSSNNHGVPYVAVTFPSPATTLREMRGSIIKDADKTEVRTAITSMVKAARWIFRPLRETLTTTTNRFAGDVRAHPGMA